MEGAILNAYSFVLVEHVPESFFTGSRESVTLLTALKHHERRHSFDIARLADVVSLIYIAFEELDGTFVGRLISHGIEDWTDLLARWAPSRGEVNDHRFTS